MPLVSHQIRETVISSLWLLDDVAFSGNSFSTLITNVFVIGEEKAPWVSLPKLKGIRKTIMEERNARLEKAAAQKWCKTADCFCLWCVQVKYFAFCADIVHFLGIPCFRFEQLSTRFFLTEFEFSENDLTAIERKSIGKTWILWAHTMTEVTFHPSFLSLTKSSLFGREPVNGRKRYRRMIFNRSFCNMYLLTFIPRTVIRIFEITKYSEDIDCTCWATRAN